MNAFRVKQLRRMIDSSMHLALILPDQLRPSKPIERQIERNEAFILESEPPYEGGLYETDDMTLSDYYVAYLGQFESLDREEAITMIQIIADVVKRFHSWFILHNTALSLFQSISPEDRLPLSESARDIFANSPKSLESHIDQFIVDLSGVDVGLGPIPER